MSRIGRLPVPLAAGVKVDMSDRTVTVVEADRNVPQRCEVSGDGAHARVALLPHRVDRKSVV